MKTLDKQKIKTAINIQTGDDGTQAKKIIEILELLEKMTLEEYKEEQKFYGQCGITQNITKSWPRSEKSSRENKRTSQRASERTGGRVGPKITS